MRRLKLMTDYNCYPLWEQNDKGATNVDPASLPISRKLCEDIDGWAEIYDRTLNTADPKNSGFKDSASEQKFKERASDLLDRLRKELGREYAITLQV